MRSIIDQPTTMAASHLTRSATADIKTTRSSRVHVSPPPSTHSATHKRATSADNDDSSRKRPKHATSANNDDSSRKRPKCATSPMQEGAQTDGETWAKTKGTGSRCKKASKGCVTAHDPPSLTYCIHPLTLCILPPHRTHQKRN